MTTERDNAYSRESGRELFAILETGETVPFNICSLSRYEYNKQRFDAVGHAWPRPWLGHDWPGLSPYQLLQELVTDPYDVLVAAVLLNRTARRQAHRAFWSIKQKWPTAFNLRSGAGLARPELLKIIAPLGFQEGRLRSLQQVGAVFALMDSDESINTSVDRISRIHGVGPYALDCWNIFVLNEWRCRSMDGWLERYLTWIKNGNSACEALSPAGRFKCCMREGHRGPHQYSIPTTRSRDAVPQDKP